MILKPGLYLVATPIGNLEDITLRAIKILKNSNIILCEDSRIAGRLLAKYEINTPLRIYNDYSTDQQRSGIQKLLDAGKIISLISDAGTPLISDPGYKLVRDLKLANYYIEVIPGPCSLIAALTLSSLPPDRFLFSGFLPKTSHAKKKIFHQLKEIAATLIFFETAPRLLASLKVAEEIFPTRKACVVREITKIYQEAVTLPLPEIRSYYEINPPKGEIILLISGKKPVRTNLINGNIQDQDAINSSNKISATECAIGSVIRSTVDSAAGYAVAFPESIVESEYNIRQQIKTMLFQGRTIKDISRIISSKYTSCSRATIYKIADSLKDN